MCNFQLLSKEQLRARKKRYPEGTRIELISMDDPYNRSLHAGCKGTITRIDPLGDLEVDWDCGSCLKVIYGVDEFRVIKATNT